MSIVHFCYKDGDIRFLQNVGYLPNNMVSHYRRYTLKLEKKKKSPISETTHSFLAKKNIPQGL